MQINDDDPATGAIYQPVMAVQGNRAYAAWVDYRQTGHYIFVSTSADGGRTWSANRVATVSPDFFSDLSLAAAPDGETLYLAWTTGYDGGIYFSRSADAGENWTEPAPVANQSTMDSAPRLISDSRAGLYLVWFKDRAGRYDNMEVQAAYSDDHGASWSAPERVEYISGECAFGWDATAIPGGGAYVVASDCGHVQLTAMAGGQLTTGGIYDYRESTAISYPLVAAGAAGVYVLWDGADEDLNLIKSADNWSSVSQVMTGRDVVDIAADGQGRLAVLFTRGGFLYLAESEDGGSSWRETALGIGSNGAMLAADPDAGTLLPVWTDGYRVYTVGRARQLVSTRTLNRHTLGVMGFVDTAAAVSAEVRLESAGTALATVDVLPLARHNAPGGGEAHTVSGAAGLWSAALSSETPLTGQEEVVLAVTDNTSQVYQERVEVPAPPGDLRLELQNIEVIDRGAGCGQVRLSGRLQPPPANMPAVRVSRWQPATAEAWPGHWVEASAGAQPQPDGRWQVEQPATPGENLYRVQAEGYPALEDVDGYYYVASVTEPLATTESHQRKQALAFRDAVREVLSSDDDYADVFPEQLILAIGASENGVFDNGIANTDGIMQVTCNSGQKGVAEGSACDTYTYTATAASIKYNVSDALLLLYNNYSNATKEVVSYDDVDCNPIPATDNVDKPDALITAVLRYNAGRCYVNIYKNQSWGNPWYLHYAARQLAPQSDDPNPPNLTPDYPNKPQKNGWKRLPGTPEIFNVAQFMGDADYTGGVGEPSDLIERLDHGQDYVNQLLLQQE